MSPFTVVFRVSRVRVLAPNSFGLKSYKMSALSVIVTVVKSFEYYIFI